MHPSIHSFIHLLYVENLGFAERGSESLEKILALSSSTFAVNDSNQRRSLRRQRMDAHDAQRFLFPSPWEAVAEEHRPGRPFDWAGIGWEDGGWGNT